MSLGRKDFSETRTDGGADVFGLAGFFRDDDLIGHNRLILKDRFDSGEREHIANVIALQAVSDSPAYESGVPGPTGTSIDAWPDHVPVSTFAPRTVCTSCGIIGADARPAGAQRAGEGIAEIQVGDAKIPGNRGRPIQGFHLPVGARRQTVHRGTSVNCSGRSYELIKGGEKARRYLANAL
jgi:hypothetical protein